MLILVSQKFRTGGLAEYTRSDKKGKFLAHHNFKKMAYLHFWQFMVLLNEREEHLQCIIYAASQSYNPSKKDSYMEINIFLYRTERLKISVTNRCVS